MPLDPSEHDLPTSAGPRRARELGADFSTDAHGNAVATLDPDVDLRQP